MKAGKIRLKDIGKPSDQMVQLNPADFMRLPYPYDKADSDPDFKQLTEAQKNKYEASLDGVLAISIPKPETKAEEEELVRKFLSGLEKLLTKENNWTFLQPLTLSLEYCAKCQTCNEACPIYIGSGKQEIYRPTYRSEVLRAIVNKYIKKGGKTFAKFSGNDIDLNWTTVARLAELAYRCTLCRRCAQTCPIGVDNGLITHELRKVFSQEMGIAPVEIHTLGSMKHLKAGSSTGL
ncbi:MAG: 4Fe-4S ferredoxin, partial [Deltaproteobacteria bacterium CG_4_10_14_0_8_um_filter_43_12]